MKLGKVNVTQLKHAKMNTTTVNTYVSMLLNACYKDIFPEDMNCLCAFMFDCIGSEEEARNLLGVYIGIAKLMPDFIPEELTQALQGGRASLVAYILRMYDDYGDDSYYSKWFRDNITKFE
jgi:hypothetical protein